MFKELQVKIYKNFKNLSKSHDAFQVDIDREIIWNTYLNSWSDADERQSNNCNCCKSFLRQFGSIVFIINNVKTTIFDDIGEIPEEYKQSISNLKTYIKSRPVKDVFFHYEKRCGHQESGGWYHFYLDLPNKFITKRADMETIKAGFRDHKNVLARSLNEFDIDTTKTVIELINNGSLYRGEEKLELLKSYLKVQKEYVKDGVDKDLLCWVVAKLKPEICRLRNHAIGTLLIDLQSGMDLNSAVTRYERVTAPANYKRPKALVTEKMIKEAEKKVMELGICDSLNRRFANESDISISDILYSATSEKHNNSVFDNLKEDVLINPKNLKKVETVTMEKFIEDIVPSAKDIEVLFENRHTNNLVSLITSDKADSKGIFQWDNNFSWSYNGGVADAIKERVKKAGGRVDGFLRISLSWFNYDDLDIHSQSQGEHIYYGDRYGRNGRSGIEILDVDMNVDKDTRTPVENMVWDKGSLQKNKKYRIYVNNFNKRESANTGFTIQVEYDGEITNMSFPQSPSHGGNLDVIEFTFDGENVIFQTELKDSEIQSNDIWGISTNKYQKVNKLMLSPNHWSGKVGNKHYMLYLDGCVSDESPRPFYNEFLDGKLNNHRKVFETLGGKLQVPDTNHQLSGIGFSNTKKDYFYARVTGQFTRTLKVTI